MAVRGSRLPGRGCPADGRWGSCPCCPCVLGTVRISAAVTPRPRPRTETSRDDESRRREHAEHVLPPPPGDPAHKRPVRIHFSAPVTAPLRGGGLHITAKHLVHSIMHFAASFAGSCRSVTWGWTQRRQPRRATCTRGAESAVVSNCMQGKSSVASQRTLYSASRGRSLASTASTRAGPSKPPSAASAVPARATTNALGTSPCRSCGTPTTHASMMHGSSKSFASSSAGATWKPLTCERGRGAVVSTCRPGGCGLEVLLA